MKVHFRSGGYTPLTVLLSALEQAHVTVKEMAVVPGENDTDTLHLRVSLPRTVGPPGLLGIVSSLKEVESATLD